MSDLTPGTVVKSGSRSLSDSAVVLRAEGGSATVLLPGVRGFSYGIVQKLRLKEIHPRPGPGAWEYLRVDGDKVPHGLMAEPVRSHDAAIAEVTPAVFRYLEAVAGAPAAELRQAALRETCFHAGDYTTGLMAATPAGFRIDAGIHEFESRDMVQMDRDWRWVALYRPLVVVGVFIGDGANQFQIVSEDTPPAAALSDLWRALRAR